MSQKRPIRPISSAFILIILLVSIGFALKTALRSYGNRVWKHSGRLTVLDAKTLTVYSYPKKKGRIISLILPQDIFVTVPGGYGEYKLKDSRELSLVEKKDYTLLKNTVLYAFGIPLNATRDELAIWDKIFIWLVRQSSAKETKTIDLSKKAVTKTRMREDGTEIDVFDNGAYDLLFGTLFWEAELKEEDAPVGVFNASGTAGLAHSISRILESSGIRVVEERNWEGKEEKPCVVRIDSKQQSTKTQERILSIFPCAVERVEQKAGGRYAIELVVTDAIL